MRKRISDSNYAYLSARLVEGGVWTLGKVDSLHFVGLLVVPIDGRINSNILRLTW
jgi:hypothetical protein